MEKRNWTKWFEIGGKGLKGISYLSACVHGIGIEDFRAIYNDERSYECWNLSSGTATIHIRENIGNGREIVFSFFCDHPDAVALAGKGEK